jgi:FAD/FMN-containing dehydrogenase
MGAVSRDRPCASSRGLDATELMWLNARHLKCPCGPVIERASWVELMSIEKIKEVLGPGGWLEGDEDTRRYRTDWRSTSEGEALLVARPDSTQTVSKVLSLAREAGIAIVPQGGNTGLVIGSIPTEKVPTIVLTLERMSAVRSLDANNFAMVVEAGCVIQNAQTYAADVDRLFPLSLASEGSSTIGGTLSTNAGGNQTIRFGNAREQVLGLEVVLADGTILDGLNTLRKNNTGYDLKHLFIGAEGTLGIITAAAMRLMPLPRVVETALLAVPDPHAAQLLLGSARELSGDTILAYELMPRIAFELAITHIEGIVDPLDEPSPWYVLMELATSSTIDDMRDKLERIVEHAMEQSWVTDGVVAESTAQRAQLWRPREEQAEAGKRAGKGVGGDVSVPVSRVAEFLDDSRAAILAQFPGTVLNTFGHMGDGNIHYNIRKNPDMDAAVWEQQTGALESLLFDVVAQFGGSFSAEHGIGSQKRATLRTYASPEKLNLMRVLKEALDPAGLMNPGKVL